jgi:alkylhydroperoxidase/carboxymuconolactone decarboxylase family protein YurZ
MKRSPELRDLSVEHHHGLVAARRMRKGSQGESPLAAAIEGFREAWRDEIAPHFRREEEILLPAFAQVAGAEDPMIVRTLTEHVALRRAVAALEAARDGAERQRLAGEIGTALEAHIRFEERVLFPAIEAALAGSMLSALGEELSVTGGRSCRMADRSAETGARSRPEPPEVVREFAADYPRIWEAYNRLGEATAEAGPLDERTQRLAKLALAIGAQRQGAVNAHVRRALAAGCSPEELIHVGILAIPTLGWPAAFAAICWIHETIRKQAGD